jgi:hypothetical protein
MKKTITLFIAAAFTGISANAQKYFTKDGSIEFHSNAKLEKIEATNNKSTCVLDAAAGTIEWSVLTKGFVFENAFMGEHFNENYMESDKFPKASFKGKVDNMSSVNLQKDGSYKSKVSGFLTMHGVTKEISVDATFTVAGGKISSEAKFPVKASDYNIVIPGDKADNISNNIDIEVKANLTELKK